MSDADLFTAEECGERKALLELRSVILSHGVKEVDAYAAQRLHDIRMDATHRAAAAPLEFQRPSRWNDRPDRGRNGSFPSARP